MGLSGRSHGAAEKEAAGPLKRCHGTAEKTACGRIVSVMRAYDGSMTECLYNLFVQFSLYNLFVQFSRAYRAGMCYDSAAQGEVSGLSGDAAFTMQKKIPRPDW